MDLWEYDPSTGDCKKDNFKSNCAECRYDNDHSWGYYDCAYAHPEDPFGDWRCCYGDCIPSTETCLRNNYCDVCNDNSDCGEPTYSTTKDCLGRHVVKEKTTPICENPGTGNSYCHDIVTTQRVEWCDFNYSCDDGASFACVNPPAINSKTADYAVAGTVYTNVYNFTDTCIDSDYLAEYLGQPGLGVDFEAYLCTGICEDDENGGKCVALLADADSDGSISVTEMLEYFDKYYKGQVTLAQLTQAYEQWKTKAMGF
jgi:hypothetical protein